MKAHVSAQIAIAASRTSASPETFIGIGVFRSLTVLPQGVGQDLVQRIAHINDAVAAVSTFTMLVHPAV
jgi:hypothetical protein